MRRRRLIVPPERELVVPRPDRRLLLRRGLGGLGLAALGGPLIGCGADDEPVRGADAGTGTDAGMLDGGVDAGPGDAGATDAGADATGADVAADAAAAAAFRFAVLADTHIIDEFYDGQESNQLDTESLYSAADRMASAVDVLNALDPKPEFVIHVGDYVHDAPWTDLDFYASNRTRLDIAAEIQSRLEMPLYAAYGNHDYRIDLVTREFTEELFAEKLGMPRYTSVDHNGWKCIVLNNFRGETWNPNSDAYNPSLGSLGEEQLQWLEAELEQGMPTFIFVHYTVGLIDAFEHADLSLTSLLMRYRDQIQYVISGHTHRWLDMGDQYGPPHMIIGATRYDEDCFMVVDVDPSAGTFAFANQSAWGMFSLYAEPWNG